MKKKCPVCQQMVKLADSLDKKQKNFSWHTDKMGFTCDNSFKKAD
jgi:hypothetical protein